ncbi:3-methyl-2-oxobutanoate hydroxymethyltransferase [Halorientalis litorea]|jgi:3-methyl-2-oxobutanoate hydroxymethyltransferase|uniref:3-methyl-2-oxobutanoate hydroxymethyltransferase n=1 Tax=Halorientalis litorea TaxID=2931977 RepID=UPI001FF6D044|nr:3-methyl-2-oxobutanoate hydroxymethyltransferase [Halorientalis litorea]
MPTVTEIRDRTDDTPITMLTAYDAPTASIVDDSGVDMILVGDSVGNVMLGHDSTLPVTLDQMVSHTSAVVRGAEDALVVADVPFLSVGADEGDSIENCGRLLKEAGADAVKIESGDHTVKLTEQLVQLGIPVMAHLGLTPQQVNQLGGHTRQGTTPEAAREILDLATEHQRAGAFALVLEHVPSNLAAQVTETLDIPTIGIGAGPACDGQVLVVNDAVGLSDWTPPFVETFGDVRGEMESAIDDYVTAVEDGEYPAEEHSHHEDELEDIY